MTHKFVMGKCERLTSVAVSSYAKVAKLMPEYVMFLLFIIHHAINRHWYKNLVKGSYPPLREGYAYYKRPIVEGMAAAYGGSFY